MIRPEIEHTLDGSPTLVHPLFGAYYHSTRGAWGESLHVFVGAGFRAVSLDEFRILEVGFGSGLNAYLSLRAAEEEKKRVEYRAVEPYPVALETARRLSYAADPLFMALHEAPWEGWVRITDRFSLEKNEIALSACRFDTVFDLVYFDAFDPDCQPEMWTGEVFERLGNTLRPGGLLVTYSAKGVVKRNLRAAGFEVKRLPGALGKHHMLRAVKL